MMIGPMALGTLSGHKAPNCDPSFDILEYGKRYRVIREFPDYNDDVHPVGEEWTFLGCSFYPHEDGMSFFVSFDGQQEWHIPLQWQGGPQGEVLNKPAEHFQAL